MQAFISRLRAIARKETRHLLREPRTLMVVFLQPVMLMVLYGYCMSFDAKNVPFAVWDQDRTEMSRQLVTRLNAAGGGETFAYLGHINDVREVEPELASGRARFVLVIPHNMERDLSAGRHVKVQALIDGADSNTAGLANGYISQALGELSSRLSLEYLEQRHGVSAANQGLTPSIGGGKTSQSPLNIGWRVLYNPDMSSRRFIVPGLIAILLTTVAASLTSTCIVRERELGPIESLLTAPVGAVELVLGKLAPYTILAAGNVLLVLLAGGIVFGVWPRGSVWDLASFSFLFTLGMLAMGMLISTRVQNQNQALLMATIGTLLPNVFLTGFAFPRSNMPEFLQWLSNPLPATQYIAAIRGIFLKAAGWSVYWPQGLWMTLICIVLLGAAIHRVQQLIVRGLD